MSVLDQPVSGKVKAGTKTAFWLAFVTSVLTGLVQLHPGLISWVPADYRVGLVGFVSAVVVAGGTFVAGWLAKHLPADVVTGAEQAVKSALTEAAEPTVDENGNVA